MKNRCADTRLDRYAIRGEKTHFTHKTRHPTPSTNSKTINNKMPTHTSNVMDQLAEVWLVSTTTVKCQSTQEDDDYSRNFLLQIADNCSYPNTHI